MSVPRAVRERTAPDLSAALHEVARTVWTELGLSSEPVVETVDGSTVDVALDGRRVPVSALRREAAVLAGTGLVRRVGEPDGAEALLTARLAVGTPSVATRIVAALLDTALRAAILAPVAPECPELARRLAGAGVKAPVDALVEAVALLANLGISAAWLAETEVADVQGEDPALLAEELARTWLSAAQPAPTIELARATLRSLTSGAERIDRELVIGDGGLKAELQRQYGVFPRSLALRVVEQPQSVVRFRFGPLRTAEYVVPIRGEAADQFDLPTPGAAVMQHLSAECAMRLAWWLPVDEEALPLWPLPTARHAPGIALDAALRRMLASRVPLTDLIGLPEQVVDLAADGETAVKPIEARLRGYLGRTIVGTGDGVVTIASEVAADAVRQQSVDELLVHHPELLTSTGPMTLVCPQQWRRPIEGLLRPLADVVVVVAASELEPREPELTQLASPQHPGVLGAPSS